MSYVFRQISSSIKLQPEKITTGKKGRVRDHYYDWKKKFQSSVWRVRDLYYDEEKKILVVCLAGARSLLRPEKKSSIHLKKSSSRLSDGCAFFITTGKKSSSRLSGGCMIVITTGKKQFQLSVWQVRDVSNLNVTNLYQFQFKLI